MVINGVRHHPCSRARIFSPSHEGERRRTRKQRSKAGQRAGMLSRSCGWRCPERTLPHGSISASGEQVTGQASVSSTNPPFSVSFLPLSDDFFQFLLGPWLGPAIIEWKMANYLVVKRIDSLQVKKLKTVVEENFLKNRI